LKTAAVAVVVTARLMVDAPRMVAVPGMTACAMAKPMKLLTDVVHATQHLMHADATEVNALMLVRERKHVQAMADAHVKAHNADRGMDYD
jgi:hypothetical protein